MHWLLIFRTPQCNAAIAEAAALAAVSAILRVARARDGMLAAYLQTGTVLLYAFICIVEPFLRVHLHDNLEDLFRLGLK